MVTGGEKRLPVVREVTTGYRGLLGVTGVY